MSNNGQCILLSAAEVRSFIISEVDGLIVQVSLNN